MLKWNGGGKGGQPVAFVGKGVTFDTGGISIKPAAGMEAMKWDMGGAGAVAGAMKALAMRKAKANVVGICGLVENMPGGNAQRPGDVVTTMSGQTVEVINTDAEGRLVLADAITYAQRNFKPSTIIDLATLTGAMLISLGHEWAGLFSNDDELAAEAAAGRRGERRQAVAHAAGRAVRQADRLADRRHEERRPARGRLDHRRQFIQRFVENGVKWAHVDMAGMAWSDKAGRDLRQGRDRLRRRLLDQYVADVLENQLRRSLTARTDASRLLPAWGTLLRAGDRGHRGKDPRRDGRLLVVAEDEAFLARLDRMLWDQGTAASFRMDLPAAPTTHASRSCCRPAPMRRTRRATC